MIWRRITPAGAGKTIRRRLDFPAAEDHPRRCGENVNRVLVEFENIGSPPQVRGKLLYISENVQPYRITPAGAGKTILIAVHPNYAADHPRRCGENYGILAVLNEMSGITPAGAGKTKAL